MPTNPEIIALLNNLNRARNFVSRVEAKLKDLRANCSHKWVFVKQTNCYSEKTWRKFYKCPECDCEVHYDGIPVCGECHTDTERLNNSDGTAVKFSTTMQVPSWEGGSSRIRGFKCTDPKCNRITLLWVDGD